jgi:hypothetical protein
MFESVITALFGAVLDEVCVDVPTHEAGKKALVVAEPLESVPKGGLDADNLRAVGRRAPLPAPSMWN